MPISATDAQFCRPGHVCSHRAAPPPPAPAPTHRTSVAPPPSPPSRQPRATPTSGRTPARRPSRGRPRPIHGRRCWLRPVAWCLHPRRLAPLPRWTGQLPRRPARWQLLLPPRRPAPLPRWPAQSLGLSALGQTKGQASFSRYARRPFIMKNWTRRTPLSHDKE